MRSPAALSWPVIRRLTRPVTRRAFGPSASPNVVIVGGGVAGIAAGVKLRQAGIDTFTIYEKSLGLGGTWRDNTYPGCEVDTHSHLYSYSFTRPDWSRSHARQPEIQKYLEGVVDQFELRRHFRFGVGVGEAAWNETTHSYYLKFDDGTTTTCHVLISAVGFLNVPRYPEWPGLDSFRGPKFHTSRSGARTRPGRQTCGVRRHRFNRGTGNTGDRRDRREIAGLPA